jgi:DNA-binding MarR family transcriptional regulator
MTTHANASDPGRFAFEGIDRILHEKARLGILTSLLGQADGLSFNDLRELCSLTDGNLSRHLSTLQEAGLVTIHKTQKGTRTRTTVLLTLEGRSRFLEYLARLEEIVQTALQSSRVSTPTTVEWKPA